MNAFEKKNIAGEISSNCCLFGICLFGRNVYKTFESCW